MKTPEPPALTPDSPPAVGLPGRLTEYRMGGRASSRPSPAASLDELADRYLEHGAYILRLLTRPEPEHGEVTGRLVSAGYLSRGDDGEFEFTRRGLRRIEANCLAGLFHTAARAAAGGHDAKSGDGEVRPDRRRSFEAGDPADRLDPHETIRNALVRSGGRAGFRLTENDLVVFDAEPTSRAATVVLLDQSASMGRYGKFLRARDAALALRALVRRRFPEDRLIVVGFGTRAAQLGEFELLRARPKPVTALAADGPRRAPIVLTGVDPLPQHFTNLQAGFRLARTLLGRAGGSDGVRQIICVTDGEPTAHLENREIVVHYPPSEQSARATLEEARRCVRDGIGVSLIHLHESPRPGSHQGSSGTGFVGRLARLTRGRVADCSLNGFGTAVVTSFVTGRRSPGRSS